MSHQARSQESCTPQNKTPAELKARQANKIRQLREALTAVGFCALDEQAKVLGISRSTCWTILRANHKQSGLSPAVIKRMLSAPQLPATVKAHILEYVREKRAGLYGHKKKQLQRFAARLVREAARQIPAAVMLLAAA